jgi:translocation protein SEC62
MGKVVDFLINTVGLKTHKAIMMQRSSVEFFRGVNFHIAVLQHGDKIMKMIPSFIEDGSIKQLKGIEDSVKLGNFMILTRSIISVQRDPRLVNQGTEKIPKYIVPDKKPLDDKGIYMVLEKEDKQTQSLYLGLIVIAILALMCFRLWPLWLKKAIWYISFYLLVFLVVTAILRVILWGILYHFGMEFWLFPNYFIDSNDPRDSFLPITSFEIREDAADIRSIIFRLISGALIVYMGYQFCQDEKNIEDLKDLAENGLTDLFEYGQDFMVGNALGDGKPKESANNTKEEELTFQQKYRKELTKDLSDFDGEEEEEETEASGESENDDTNAEDANA